MRRSRARVKYRPRWKDNAIAALILALALWVMATLLKL